MPGEAILYNYFTLVSFACIKPNPVGNKKTK